MNLTENAVRKLTDHYVHLYPEEVSGYLEKQLITEITSFLNKHKPSTVVPIINRMSAAVASQVLADLDENLFKDIVSQMDLNQAAIFISQWDDDLRQRRLEYIDSSTANDLRTLLSYSPDSAGYYMDPHVLMFRTDATVQDVVKAIRLQRRRVVDVFVVDNERILKGKVNLEEILISEESEPLGLLIKKTPMTIQAVSSRDEAVELFEKGHLTTLPVVDYAGRLLGVIRQQAIMRAAEQEASANIQTMVGVSKDERAFSKISFAIKKRLPWLHINLATAFLAAAVVGLFENTIAKFTALAVLMPVVAGQSGNTGAQALAVTMRGLVLREVRIRQWPRVLWKEANVGLINGVAVALTTSIGVLIWSQNLGLALIIAVAMVISMVAASLAGALIPILLSVFGQDPATSSSIILTTVTDVVGFLSFLGLAAIFASLLS